MLVIASSVRVPLEEIELSAIRAQGSGGQHVNKAATAIHLRFDSQASSLPATWKEALRRSFATATGRARRASPRGRLAPASAGAWTAKRTAAGSRLAAAASTPAAARARAGHGTRGVDGALSLLR